MTLCTRSNLLTILQSLETNTSYKRTAANYIIPKCIIADVGDLVETKTLANQTNYIFIRLDSLFLLSDKTNHVLRQ